MATNALPIPVPSLSLDGWVTDASSKLDYLMSHFFLSEKSQTALYSDNVSSLQWILQDCLGDMVKANRDINEVLNIMLARYFTTVNCDTSIVEESEGSSRYNLNIYLSVKDVNGVEVQINKVVKILDSKISSVFELINNGPEN